MGTTHPNRRSTKDTTVRFTALADVHGWLIEAVRCLERRALRTMRATLRPAHPLTAGGAR